MEDETLEDQPTAPDDLPNDGYEPENEEPLETPTEDEAPPEPEAQAAESAPAATLPTPAPFRPQFNQPAEEQAATWLRENFGEDTLNAVDVLLNARLANSRQAQTVSDHYVGQIDNAAPGFLSVRERTALRNLPPQAQANPSTTFFMAVGRYMEQADQTGDAAAAIDAFVSDWQAKRGKPTAAPKAPPPVIPPSQRVSGAAAGGSATRTTTRARTPGPSGTVAALFGIADDEADGYIQTSKRR